MSRTLTVHSYCDSLHFLCPGNNSNSLWPWTMAGLYKQYLNAKIKKTAVETTACKCINDKLFINTTLWAINTSTAVDASKRETNPKVKWVKSILGAVTGWILEQNMHLHRRYEAQLCSGLKSWSTNTNIDCVCHIAHLKFCLTLSLRSRSLFAVLSERRWDTYGKCFVIG